MRIIAGEYKGRQLKAPKGDATRPTADRVREALMSALASARGGFEGAVVLDAFAGSGALGLEALSRGARYAAFCEKDASALRTLQGNIDALGLARERYAALRTDILKNPPRLAAAPFDLVFLDPPYGTELLEKALLRIFQFDILTNGGIIICESGRDKRLPDAKAPYVRKRDYVYGQTKLTVYTKEGD